MNLLFDTDSSHLVHISDALQHLLYTVLLQSAHPFFQGDRQQFGDASVFLYPFLQDIGAYQ
jgi:hypothetical protein